MRLYFRLSQILRMTVCRQIVDRTWIRSAPGVFVPKTMHRRQHLRRTNKSTAAMTYTAVSDVHPSDRAPEKFLRPLGFAVIDSTNTFEAWFVRLHETNHG